MVPTRSLTKNIKISGMTTHYHSVRFPHFSYLLDVGDAGQGGALEHLRSCEGPQVLLGDVLVGEGDVARRHEQERPGGDDEAHG